MSNQELKVGDVVKVVDNSSYPEGCHIKPFDGDEILQIYAMNGEYVYVMHLNGKYIGKKLSGGWFPYRFEKLPEDEAIVYLI